MSYDVSQLLMVPLPAIIFFVDDEAVGRLIGINLESAGFVTAWFQTATGVIAGDERLM
jgi:hypothetical protein